MAAVDEGGNAGFQTLVIPLPVCKTSQLILPPFGFHLGHKHMHLSGIPGAEYLRRCIAFIRKSILLLFQAGVPRIGRQLSGPNRSIVHVAIYEGWSTIVDIFCSLTLIYLLSEISLESSPPTPPRRSFQHGQHSQHRKGRGAYKSCKEVLECPLV